MSTLTRRMRAIRLSAIGPAILLLAACSSPVGGTPGPTVIPASTAGATLTAGQLRLLLIDTLGPRWYCDPDVYPIAHGSDHDPALAPFAEMQAAGDRFQDVPA